MGQLETGKDTTNQVNPNAVATKVLLNAMQYTLFVSESILDINYLELLTPDY